MSTKSILIGCGVALALFIVVVIAGGVGYFIWSMGEPLGMVVSLDAPTHVTVGEKFDLVVRVNNQRDSKDMEITDIDISEDYLRGFSVLSIDPPVQSSMHVPLVDMTSYTFNVTIPAASTGDFTFTLQAELQGIYRNDLDVYEGGRFTTTTVQTTVKPAE